jgi:hypothetical protein
MDIIEFVEGVMDVKLFDFQKEYVTRLYDIYKKDPDSFNKFIYPCCRGYAKFNAMPSLAVLFSIFDKEVKDKNGSRSIHAD